MRLRGSVSVCAASLWLLAACRQSGRGFTVTDSHRAERDRCVGSLGHCRFKALFTDGPCVVRRLALTVGNVSKIFPYFALFRHASDGRQEHSCHFQLTDMRACSKSLKSCRLAIDNITLNITWICICLRLFFYWVLEITACNGLICCI